MGLCGPPLVLALCPVGRLALSGGLADYGHKVTTNKRHRQGLALLRVLILCPIACV